MGKEADLLKAVKNNDQHKLQKLFLPEKGYQVKKITQTPSKPTSPGGRIRLHLDHININCTDPATGYTPLITAVLNGHKDVADSLLFHSAHVDLPDSKGNTPLHVAAFAGNVDMVDLLLQNRAKVNLQNSDGNTPLHIVCQSDSEHKIIIILKLLKLSPSVSLENKNHESPLDIAAMFNKKDVLSVMLDHDASLKKNTSAIIEAAIRGHTEVVQLLLDYGVDPNGICNIKETGPLHEATRFVRFGVAEILLKYGATAQTKNNKNESPESIAKEHPKPVAEKFYKLFEEYSLSGATSTPKFVDNTAYIPRPVKIYPELPTDITWTHNSPEFCNSCTAKHPNTNLLDGDLQTFWVIQEVHHAWTVLDLHSTHTLTGITIYGWDSDQMVKGFEIERGEALSGPWTTVGSFTCKREGSNDPKQPAVAQRFNGFEESSRFWRLHLLSNHGGSYLCFQGIALHGADDRIIQTMESLDMSQHTDNIIMQGYNTFNKFLVMGNQALLDICKNEDHVNIISNELRIQRKSSISLSSLRWVQPPPYSVTVGEIIPNMVVKADNSNEDELELFAEDNSGVLLGRLKVCLCPHPDFTEPSKATFTGIKFNQAGKFRLCVRQTATSGDVLLKAPADIEIKPVSKLSPEMEDAFRDMESMLMDLQTSLEPKT